MGVTRLAAFSIGGQRSFCCFQFVGCTSISEAFHKLDLARAVTDVQRFNYVCKVGRS